MPAKRFLFTNMNSLRDNKREAIRSLIWRAPRP
jgi:hypothetical protein